jgi:hypothetical protein
MKEQKSFFGLYKTRGAAESSVLILKKNGFRQSDISLILPQLTGSQDFVHVQSSHYSDGALIGIGIGSLIGAVFTGLMGFGLIRMTGSEVLSHSGLAVSILTGLAVGGILGAIVGILFGVSIPEYKAKRYSGNFKEGGFLISVHVDNKSWAERARTLLESTGAKNIALLKELEGDKNSSRPRSPISVGGPQLNRVF